MQYIRSSLFSLAMIISTIIVAILILIFFLAPFTFRARIAQIYAWFIVWSLKFFCGVDYKITGRENIPDKSAIIFSNHQSAWETYGLQLIFFPVTWVLKRELMWLPFFGWGMALLKPIAIDRSSGRKAVNQIIAKGKKRLDKGIWVIIFPEGTRIAPGKKKRWGIGGAVLGETSKYPIVPVAHNAGEFWGRRSFLKKPGTIQVVIGKPVETRGLNASQINEKVGDWINSTMAEISSVHSN